MKKFLSIAMLAQEEKTNQSCFSETTGEAETLKNPPSRRLLSESPCEGSSGGWAAANGLAARGCATLGHCLQSCTWEHSSSGAQVSCQVYFGAVVKWRQQDAHKHAPENVLRGNVYTSTPCCLSDARPRVLHAENLATLCSSYSRIFSIKLLYKSSNIYNDSSFKSCTNIPLFLFY